MARKYSSVREMLDAMENCGNCRFENESEKHPACQKCINSTGNGWRPRRDNLEENDYVTQHGINTLASPTG
jgi:hypothetical protein